MKSEFFGPMRGARLPAAVKDRIGRFEAAAGGNPIPGRDPAEIPLGNCKANCCAFLQEKMFTNAWERRGNAARGDVRIVAGPTNRDLKKEGRGRAAFAKGTCTTD